MRRLTQWLATAVVLSLAGAAWAAAPVELATDPPSNDPIPRCIVDGGPDQGDQLSVLRTGCDVLAFSNGFGHGFIHPCDPNSTCTADGNGNSCSAGEQLWLCFGTGS